MARSYFSALIFLFAIQGAQGQELCTPPVPPPPLNGAEASPEQLRAAIAKARDFIGQANLYEGCLRDELRAAQIRGEADPVDRQTRMRIAANRKLKDKVSAEAATALDAYKKAHPN